MSERFGIGTITENVSDFGKELVHSALVNPYNAVVQISDKVTGASLPQIEMHGADNKESFGAKAGALAGFVVDFAALSLATKGATKPLLKAMGVGESSALASATTMGLTGGIYGGVFTPTENGQDLLTSRLKQAGVQAGTFAAMSLATSALGGAGFEGSLTRRIGVNAAGGAVGGATNAVLNERLINDRWASGSEIAQQAGSFALFGAAFAGLDYAIGRGVHASREARGVETYPKGITEMLTPLKRLSDEPILGPRDGNKFDSAGAFNPTATRLPNGDVAILYRAQDGKGVSTVGYARTAPDGKTILERSDEPVLAPRVENEKFGIEDPRVTVDTVNPNQYDLTATKYDGKDAQLADWTSADLKNWHERGIMMPANEGTWNTQWTKSGSIVSREIDGKMVPEKIDGKFWMFYMGSRNGIDELGLASSHDGVKWTDATDQPVLPGRPGQFDSNVVEPGPAAIITKDGINLIYSGGMPYEGSKGMFKYQSGLAVFDKTDPTKLLYRSSKPIFSPETPWEIENSSSTVHQVPNVVFPQGIVPDGKNGYLVYYGAADSYVGLAHTKFAPVNQFSGIADSLRQSLVRSPAALTLEEKKEK
ncbi:MAG: hypothetical protein HYX67_02495 [Candidatus Melainabacteria bacterium]|nr:hypothetical protein [Candidatus Melainabacteria bacterium]